jgi:hypothetical protein
MIELSASIEWQAFDEALAMAYQRYCEHPEDRRWVIWTLAAAMRLFEGGPASHHPAFVLLGELRCSILELDNSVVGPTLRPKEFDHRPKDGYARQMIKIRSAVAMTILMENGLSREAAARKITGMLRDCGVTISEWSKGQLTWTAVANWRYQLRKGDTVSSREYERALVEQRRVANKGSTRTTSDNEHLLDELLQLVMLRQPGAREALKNRKASRTRGRWHRVESTPSR